MKHLPLLAVLALFFSVSCAVAQNAAPPPLPGSLPAPAPLPASPMPAGPDIVSEALCFTLVNEAPYKVYGNFGTDYYTSADGTQARHRSNFRLDEAGAKDPEKGFLLDTAEFCSYGPFYEGRKLELVLRTLVPIFSCKTKIDQGPIVITGFRKPEGGTETKAACFE